MKKKLKGLRRITLSQCRKNGACNGDELEKYQSIIGNKSFTIVDAINHPAITLEAVFFLFDNFYRRLSDSPLMDDDGGLDDTFIWDDNPEAFFIGITLILIEYGYDV